MKIHKKRIYLRLPMPWRKRIQPLANVVDEIQQEIERYIGWKKNYKTQFAIRLSAYNYNIADTKLICKMLQHLCPDLKSIKPVKSKSGFNFGIKGEVSGKTPELKRIEIQRGKKRRGRSCR